MNLPDIGELVPHDGTMSLLDKVIAAADDTLCAAVTIAPATLFCGEHGVGSWVGVEYMAQSIAAHAGWKARQRGENIKVGFLLGARRYQCSVPAFESGTVLHVHVQHVLQGENGLAAYDCRIENADGGAVLAQATLTVFQPDNVQNFLQTGQT